MRLSPWGRRKSKEQATRAQERRALGLRSEDPDQALRLFEVVLQTNPNSVVSLRAAGRLLMKARRLEEAQPYWARLAKLLPEDPEPHIQLGRIHRRAGRRDAAQLEADKALALAPHHAAAIDLQLRMASAPNGAPATGSAETRPGTWSRLWPFRRKLPPSLAPAEREAILTSSPDALMARARAFVREGNALGFVRTLETLLVAVGPSRNIVDLAVEHRILIRRAASGRLLTLLDLALAVQGDGGVEEVEAELARRTKAKASSDPGLELVVNARAQIADGDVAGFLKSVRTALAVDGPTPRLLTLAREQAAVINRTGERRLVALIQADAFERPDELADLEDVEAELARRTKAKARSDPGRELVVNARAQIADGDVAGFLKSVRTALAVDGPTPRLLALVCEQEAVVRRSGEQRLTALIETDSAGRTVESDDLEAVERALSKRASGSTLAPAAKLLAEARTQLQEGDVAAFLRTLRTALALDGPSPALMTLIGDEAAVIRRSGDPRLLALLEFNSERDRPSRDDLAATERELANRRGGVSGAPETRLVREARARVRAGDIPGFLEALQRAFADEGPSVGLTSLVREHEALVSQSGDRRLQVMLAVDPSIRLVRTAVSDPRVSEGVSAVQAALADSDIRSAAQALGGLATLAQSDQSAREALGAQAEPVLLALKSGRAKMHPRTLAALERRLVKAYAEEPWVIQALARQRELAGDAAGALALYGQIADHAAGAGPALLHAATLALGLGRDSEAWEFARRSSAASPEDRRLAATLSDLFRHHGQMDRAIECWRIADAGGKLRLWVRLGLVRALEAAGDRTAVLVETTRTLRDMPPLDEMTPPDTNTVIEITRHLVQSQSRATVSDGLDELASMMLAKESPSPLRAWILASIDLARPDLERALVRFDEGISLGRPIEGVPLDLHAEKALALQRYHRFGEAFAAWEAADQETVRPNGHYSRRRNFVRQVADLCAGDPRRLLYPECLFDILFEDITRLPPECEPNTGHLVMVSGSLGQGGGERQTITVVRRMIGDPRLQKLSLLVRSTHMREHDDFFLSRVAELPVDLTVYGADWEKRTNIAELLPEFADRPRVVAAIDLMPTNSREEVARLCRQLFDRRPQAVHIWQDIPYAAVACALVGIPYFFVHRGSLAPDYWAQSDYQTATHFRPMRHIYRRLLERPGFVLLNNSVSGCQTDQNWLGWPRAEPFQVVYNAVDFSQLGEHVGRNLALRRELGIPDDSPVIGGSFRIVPVKRPRYWIEAARQIREAIPNAHFLIIGDGDMTEEVAAFAARHGFGEAMHLPGRVANVGDWYRAMDLKLLTSEREGIPNAIIEAQHFGVPIVATHVGGIHEAIDPGQTGYVTPGDLGPDPYATQVIAVLRDSAWHEAAREKAQRFVHDKFSLDTVVERLMGYYGMDRGGESAGPAPTPRIRRNRAARA